MMVTLASTTEFVAWWGAVVATLVLAWDVYKWWTAGPRIRMTVQANMRTFGEEELAGKTLVVVEATNVGERAATLKLLGFTLYPSIWRLLIRKPEQHFVVKNPGKHTGLLPHKLDPGATWTGLADQPKDLQEMATGGLLYCTLYCSFRDRPIARRVKVCSSARASIDGD